MCELCAVRQTGDVPSPSGLSPGLQAYRNWLVESDRASSDAYDKAVMTLSGGALAISLTFVKDVVKTPQPETVDLLAYAWSCLAVSIVAILISMLTSQWALRRAIQQVDQGKIYQQKPGSWLAIITMILSTSAGAAFVGGIFFLARFSIQNMHPVAAPGASGPVL